MTASNVRRQVLLLASAQALFQTASVMVMTVGGLAGAMVAPDPSLATAPIASMFLGTALVTMPASMWMARVGRRIGFVTGAGLGLLAGVLAAVGVWMGSLAVLSLGTFFVGAYQAFAQFYRFAAGEVADDAFKSRAISLVLAGGIVAALLGPALGRYGQSLLTATYAGSFLLMAVVSLAAAALLTRLQVPAVSQVQSTQAARPLSAIMAQPVYLIALFAAATGYGVMILAMTATPIAMVHHRHPLSDASTVIQLHVLGMFVPSFFTGSLIARFGVLRVMLTGVMLLGFHVASAATGTGFESFAVALVLLGVGWNFLYVGGTTLLTSTYTAAERAKAQAANDLSIFAVGLVSSLGAGALLNAMGWRTLNLVLLPWLGAAGLALVILALRQRAAAVDLR